MPAFGAPAPDAQNDVPSMVVAPRTLLVPNAVPPSSVLVSIVPAPSMRATIRLTADAAVLGRLPVVPGIRLYPARTTYFPLTDSCSSPSDVDPEPLPVRLKAWL